MSSQKVSSRMIALALFALAFSPVSAPAQPPEKGRGAPQHPAAPVPAAAPAVHVPVVFSNGHDTDPRDRGRPVILVASALGVPPEVFREAFTHVHPAPPGQGGPTPDEARRNKAALMAALAPYGVTNERLDTVSNYYRYVRSPGQLWPTRPAAGYALVRHGIVTGYVVTDGGSGYISPPTVTVPGVAGAVGVTTVSFSADFDKNGAVATLAAGPTRKG